MKIWPIILLLLIGCSCTDNEPKTESESAPPKPQACLNKSRIILNSAGTEFQWNMTETKAEIFARLERITGESLCNTLGRFQGRFIHDSLELVAPIFTDKHCENTNVSYPEGFLQAHPYRCDILMNASGKLLVSGYLVSIDSLENTIENVLVDSSNKRFHFTFDFDNDSPIQLRKYVINSLFHCYFKVVNSMSIKEFGTELCNLKEFQIEELKKKKSIFIWYRDIVHPKIVKPGPKEFTVTEC